MKVLHVTPSISRAYGGPTESLRGFLRASHAAGIATTVVAPACDPEDAAWFAAEAPETELLLYPGFGKGAFVGSPGLWRWLAREGGRFDFLHIHGLLNPISSLSAQLCMRRGWPYALRPFGTLSRYTFRHRRSRLKAAYFRLLDGRAVARAAALHFTTSTERTEAEWHGLPLADRGHVIPPPFVATDSPFAGSIASMADVLFLARLHPVKDVESLIAAWPLVVAEEPGARLILAGDGEREYVSSLRRLVQAGGVEASVEFRGFVAGEEKRELLRRSRVFVLPSHHENFGISVLEAIGAGLPVVITPEVQLSQFVAEHGLGRIADRAPASLGAAIVAALRDADLQQRCRMKGSAIVRDRYSPVAIGQRLAAMYRGGTPDQSN